MNRIRIIFFLAASFFLASPLTIQAEKIVVEGYPYFLDLPEGWEPVDTSDFSRLSFASADHTVVFQIFSFKGDKYFKATDIYKDIKSRLKAEGDAENFAFMSKNACIAEMSFSTGKLGVKGYFIFINGETADYAVSCFAEESSYEANLAFIFSALDSFALDGDGRRFPGPISQAYYPFPGPETEDREIDFNGKKHTVKLDPNELDAATAVVEREALILSAYPAGSIEAAKRFYRIIYRDNYQRLSRLVSAISSDYKSGKKTQEQFILDSLLWIQDFTYERTKTLSDINPPIECAISRAGDCDSRSLLYVTLLRHFNIDSVLLISPSFKHAGGGVLKGSVKKDGISILADGKQYLFAETTKKTPIGTIAADVFDPKEWISIDLEE